MENNSDTSINKSLKVKSDQHQEGSGDLVVVLVPNVNADLDPPEHDDTSSTATTLVEENDFSDIPFLESPNCGKSSTSESPQRICDKNKRCDDAGHCANYFQDDPIIKVSGSFLLSKRNLKTSSEKTVRVYGQCDFVKKNGKEKAAKRLTLEVNRQIRFGVICCTCICVLLVYLRINRWNEQVNHRLATMRDVIENTQTLKAINSETSNNTNPIVAILSKLPVMETSEFETGSKKSPDNRPYGFFDGLWDMVIGGMSPDDERKSLLENFYI